MSGRPKGALGSAHPERESFIVKHAQYMELRREGSTPYEAADAVGLRSQVTANKYERGFQAIERGEIPLRRTPREQ